MHQSKSKGAPFGCTLRSTQVLSQALSAHLWAHPTIAHIVPHIRHEANPSYTTSIQFNRAPVPYSLTPLMRASSSAARHGLVSRRGLPVLPADPVFPPRPLRILVGTGSRGSDAGSRGACSPSSGVDSIGSCSSSSVHCTRRAGPSQSARHRSKAGGSEADRQEPETAQMEDIDVVAGLGVDERNWDDPQPTLANCPAWHRSLNGSGGNLGKNNVDVRTLLDTGWAHGSFRSPRGRDHTRSQSLDCFSERVIKGHRA